MNIICINCGYPCIFGKNVYSHEGMKEASISGMCETCFDDLFEDMEHLDGYNDGYSDGRSELPL